MVEAGDIFHNPDLAGALGATGVDWLFTGENVGVGPDVVEIHDAFVASLHHYENIVRPGFDQIGVGVLSKPGGGVYVTHIFAQLNDAPDPPDPQPAPPPPTRISGPTPTPQPVVEAAPTAAPVAPEQASTVVVVEGGIVAPGPPFRLPVERPEASPLFRELLSWILGS